MQPEGPGNIAALYGALGLTPSATQDQVRTQYRRLVLQVHPDKHPGDVQKEEAFKAISAAYNILSDPDRLAAFCHSSTDASGKAVHHPGFWLDKEKLGASHSASLVARDLVMQAMSTFPTFTQQLLAVFIAPQFSFAPSERKEPATPGTSGGAGKKFGAAAKDADSGFIAQTKRVYAETMADVRLAWAEAIPQLKEDQVELTLVAAALVVLLILWPFFVGGM